MSEERTVTRLRSAAVDEIAQSSQLDIPLAELSAAGALETVGTANYLSGMWVDMFASALSPHVSELHWRRGGLGRGRETKRSFSNIMGRFCARWYLTAHEGVLGLEPIEGENEIVSSLVVHRRVDESTGRKVDLPDWLGWSRHGLVLAEAKGSHDGGEWASKLGGPPDQQRPHCITGALRQLSHANLKLDGEAVQSKTWAVASRWCTDDRPFLPPMLYAVDPDHQGKQIPTDRLRAIIAQLETKKVARLLFGMGFLQLEVGLEKSIWGDRNFVAGMLGHAEPRTTQLANARTLEGFQAAFGVFGVIPIRGDDDLVKLKAIEKSGLRMTLIGVSADRLSPTWEPFSGTVQFGREAGRVDDRGVSIVTATPDLPLF
ncbi:hypothetical protein [Maricaulis sp.]|uniref:hypothetical protein n=1 Tax=Maricaulis sp. TaxID=1486257 RepID=UPI003A940A9F